MILWYALRVRLLVRIGHTIFCPSSAENRCIKMLSTEYMKSSFQSHIHGMLVVVCFHLPISLFSLILPWKHDYLNIHDMGILLPFISAKSTSICSHCIWKTSSHPHHSGLFLLDHQLTPKIMTQGLIIKFNTRL